MEQSELITKIKTAFERVHKKVGVFQVGELDELFSEFEEPLESKEEVVVATPLIKEAIASTKLDGETQTGDDKSESTGNSTSKEGNKEDTSTEFKKELGGK